MPTLDLYDPDLSRQHQGAMTINSDARHKVRTQGYYVQDQIKLNEAWLVLLGLRLDRFNIDSTNRLLDASASRAAAAASARAPAWFDAARPFLLRFVQQDLLAHRRRPHRHHAQRARQHQ